MGDRHFLSKSKLASFEQCPKRLPGLAVASTVDLLLTPDVRAGLGEADLGHALYGALVDARIVCISPVRHSLVQRLSETRSLATTFLAFPHLEGRGSIPIATQAPIHMLGATHRPPHQ
jgi:hypothetical protein